MLVDDITRELLDEMPELEGEPPSDAITAFRITEKVFIEMEKELGKGWMNDIGIT